MIRKISQITFEIYHYKLKLRASKKRSENDKKKSFLSMGYIDIRLWYIKIDVSQNMDQSTSLERSFKKLLNVLISFEIHDS